MENISSLIHYQVGRVLEFPASELLELERLAEVDKRRIGGFSREMYHTRDNQANTKRQDHSSYCAFANDGGYCDAVHQEHQPVWHHSCLAVVHGHSSTGMPVLVLILVALTLF